MTRGALLWVALVVAGYASIVALIPPAQGRLWAVAAFTLPVTASGAWMITELRKATR